MFGGKSNPFCFPVNGQDPFCSEFAKEKTKFKNHVWACLRHVLKRSSGEKNNHKNDVGILGEFPSKRSALIGLFVQDYGFEPQDLKVWATVCFMASSFPWIMWTLLRPTEPP